MRHMKSLLQKILPFVASAALVLTACQQKVADSIDDSTSSSGTTSEASEASWQTYESPYQFSFSYPSDIQLQEEFEGKKITGYNYDPNNIEVAGGGMFGPNQYKIEISFSSRACEENMFSGEPGVAPLEKISVSGFPGYKWTADGSHLMCFSMTEGTVHAAMHGAADSNVKAKFIDSFKGAKAVE